MLSQAGAREAIADGLLSHRVYGVDFGGAKDAGKKLWLAAGKLVDDTLLIESCQRAETLPDSGRLCAACLKALRAKLVRDRGGDARDAMIAFYATGRALSDAARLPVDVPSAQARQGLCI